VTVRTLETLIRFATAHAKLKLSKTVEMDNIEVVHFMLTASILNKNMGKKMQLVKVDKDMKDESECAGFKITRSQQEGTSR